MVLRGMGVNSNAGTGNIDGKWFYNIMRDRGKACVLLEKKHFPMSRCRTRDTKVKRRFLWLGDTDKSPNRSSFIWTRVFLTEWHTVVCPSQFCIPISWGCLGMPTGSMTLEHWMQQIKINDCWEGRHDHSMDLLGPQKGLMEWQIHLSIQTTLQVRHWSWDQHVT